MPAQDRSQLGVAEFVNSAVIVHRRVDYLHGLAFVGAPGWTAVQAGRKKPKSWRARLCAQKVLAAKASSLGIGCSPASLAGRLSDDPESVSDAPAGFITPEMN